MADETYVLTDEELKLVNELDEVRTQQKGLKARESELRSKILGALGEKTRGLTAAGSQVVNVTVQHRRTVNSQKLEALFPDVYAEVVEEKPATVLKLG